MDSFAKIQAKNVYVVMMLHKYDIAIQVPELETKISSLKQKVTKLLAKTPSVFYETTIYEPYSIFQAISDGILHQMSGQALFDENLMKFAQDKKSPAAIVVTNTGYVMGHWHTKNVDIKDLAKFYRSIFNATKVFMKEEDDIKQIAGSDNFSTAVLLIQHNKQLVLFSLMVPKDLAFEYKQKSLENKKEEILKILLLLKP